MVQKESLTTWRDPDLLRTLLQMELMMTAVATAHVGGAGLGGVDQVLTLSNLVYLFFEGDDPEFAEAANQVELLHVQGPEAGIVESPGHHAKRVTHKHLVHPMAGQEIRGRQLDVVPCIRGRDSQNVVLGVYHQVMCLEHGQGKRMKPKKPEQGTLGDHGYVDQ